MSRSLKYYREIPNLLYRMNRMTLTGIFQRPPGYEILRRIPPQSAPRRSPHPGKIEFEEDYLYDKLYQRMPELRDEKNDLLHSKPNLTTKILRQWNDKILNGMGEEEGFQRTFQSLKPEIDEYRNQIIFNPDSPSIVSSNNINSLLKSRLIQMEKLRRMDIELNSVKKPQSVIDQIEERINFKPGMRKNFNRNNAVTDTANDTIVNRYEADFRRNADVYRLFLTPAARAAIERMMAMDEYLVQDAEHLPLATRQYHYWIFHQPWFKRFRTIRIRSQQIYRSAFDQVEIHPQAKFRDFVAYILRFQAKILKESRLIPLFPYTNCISPELYKLSRVVLNCSRIENLIVDGGNQFDRDALEIPFDSNDISEGGKSIEYLQSQYGLLDGNKYLIRDFNEKNKILSHDEINQHKLLMYYIDLAIKNYSEEPNFELSTMDQLFSINIPVGSDPLISRPPPIWRRKAEEERKKQIEIMRNNQPISLSLSSPIQGEERINNSHSGQFR